MKMVVKFEGGAELSANLAKLGDEATKAGRRGLRATARELQAALVEAAPRSEGGSRKYWKRANGTSASEYYGQLHENIKVREVAARKDHTIVMRVTTGNAFWGLFLEFGTVRMRARPWFRPVFDRMHNRLIDALAKSLGSEIEKAGKRIDRRIAARRRG